MSEPEQFPRRILLAVTGLSPQIVTETLYALAVQQDPAFIPTELHLITTQEGAKRAQLALLSDSPGGFHSLRKDYQLPEIAFPTANIHVLSDARGKPLEDIRTPEDNRMAADLISSILRELTADPESALHVSIAGGRKTMGFFIGYALTLFGRAQDRMSHVLVSPPFESSYQFFYPTPYAKVIEVAGQQLADAASAQVTLADIPFVRLRHDLPNFLLKGRASYNETVDAACRSLGPAELIVDLRAGRQGVTAGGTRCPIPPAQLALLAVFTRRLLNGEEAIGAPSKESPDPDWAARYLRELRAITGPMGDLDAAERALRNGMDGHYFSPTLSRLRSALRQHLGPVSPYDIDDGACRPKRYALTLPAAAVQLLE